MEKTCTKLQPYKYIIFFFGFLVLTIAATIARAQIDVVNIEFIQNIQSRIPDITKHIDHIIELVSSNGILEEKSQILVENIRKTLKTYHPNFTSTHSADDNSEARRNDVLKALDDEKQTFQKLAEEMQSIIRDNSIAALNNNEQILQELCKKIDTVMPDFSKYEKIKNIANDTSEIPYKTLGTSFTTKILENIIKSEHISSEFFQLSNVVSAAAILPTIEVKTDNILVNWIGEAMAMSIIHNEQMFYKYIKAKIIGEVARKILQENTKNVPSGMGIKTSTIDFIVTCIELRLLSMFDTCSLSGALIGSLFKTNNSSKSLESSLVVRGCKHIKYQAGMEAQKNGFSAPKADDYVCSSQLNDDGSSIKTCDRGDHWKIISIMSKFFPATRAIPVTFLDYAIPTPSILLRTSYREGGFGILNPILYLKKLLSLKSVFEILNDASYLYRWFYQIPSSVVPDLRESVPTTRIVTRFWSIFNAIGTEYSILHGYGELPDKQIYYITGDELNSTSSGNLPAFVVGPSEAKAIIGNDLIELKIIGHVAPRELITITEAISSNPNDQCSAITPLVITGTESTSLRLTGCKKNTPHALRVKYRVGGENMGEYYNGMIWFKVSDNRNNTETSAPPINNNAMKLAGHDAGVSDRSTPRTPATGRNSPSRDFNRDFVHVSQFLSLTNSLVLSNFAMTDRSIMSTM